MNIMFLLWTKLKIWSQTKAEHSKQPLTRENAYSLSILGKVSTYADVLEGHKKWLLHTIKEEAKLHNNYLLWQHLDTITPEQKEELVDYLSKLGYQILYTDARVMLITWLWEPNSFKK